MDNHQTFRRYERQLSAELFNWNLQTTGTCFIFAARVIRVEAINRTCWKVGRELAAYNERKVGIDLTEAQSAKSFQAET